MTEHFSALSWTRWAMRPGLVVVAAAVIAATTTAQPREGIDRPVTVTSLAASTNQLGAAGSLDAVVAAEGGVEVTGWAISLDSGSQPWLEVQARGVLLARFQPDRLRLDVKVALGEQGAQAGFNHVIAVPAGEATVCVDAVGNVSGAPIRLGCGTADPVAAAGNLADLTQLVRGLGRQAEDMLPGTRVALAVIPFDTGEIAAWRGDRLFISASAPKSWWTAAALAAGRADEAAEFAPAVFEDSSDFAAGSMIDLAGGIDAVNDFTLNTGMNDTAAIKWIKAGVVRVSEQFPGPLNGSNHVDASDAATFFYRLGTNQILSPDLRALLAGWMRLSPRDSSTKNSEASTIADSLPPDVQELVEQKGGWLRPDDFPVAAHLLGVGIVHPTNGGPSYAVALMSAGGSNAVYRRVIEFFQSASCQIYVHVASDESWECPAW